MPISIFSGTPSSSEKSIAASILDKVLIILFLHKLIGIDKPLFNCCTLSFLCFSVSASIISFIASACTKSIFPLIIALFENSPASANLSPLILENA